MSQKFKNIDISLLDHQRIKLVFSTLVEKWQGMGGEKIDLEKFFRALDAYCVDTYIEQTPSPKYKNTFHGLTKISPHCKPSPFDKQFYVANTTMFTLYVTFQSNHKEIFQSRQL
jgi:hypothetical protein